MKAEKKYEDVPFPGMELIQGYVDTSEIHGQKPMRAKGSAYCPGCRRWNTGAKIGVIELSGHLVWKQHYKTTYSGARIECPTSGTRLCDTPPIVKLDTKIETCSCIE